MDWKHRGGGLVYILKTGVETYVQRNYHFRAEDKDLLQSFKEKCKKENENMSLVVRKLINGWVNESPNEPEPPPPVRELLPRPEDTLDTWAQKFYGKNVLS